VHEDGRGVKGIDRAITGIVSGRGLFTRSTNVAKFPTIKAPNRFGRQKNTVVNSGVRKINMIWEVDAGFENNLNLTTE
jgi:hypothetical protein